MKKAFLFFTTFFFFASAIFSQQIPYNNTFDWESNISKCGTGLGVADINGDGWKDIIIANGNDIARNRIDVHYNLGNGEFNTVPDWISDDVDYHGQLSVGDVNNDGWLDVAVSVYIGENGFSEPGKIKVYYNNEGELEKTPSFVSDGFYSFSCAFGDADGDGDLDLAAACGEEYYNNPEYSKIFINNNGVFDSIPNWETENLLMAYDLEFADFDRNGFLDLALGTTQAPSYLFLANENGVIPETHSWKTVEQNMSVNSLDVGDVNNDGFLDLVLTNNGQVVDIEEIHLYTFTEEIPDSSAPSWISESLTYASGIFLYDINKDKNLDLIHGGWWEPIFIRPGNGNNFDEIEYTSITQPVTEAFQISDLGREKIQTKTDTIIVDKDDISVIYLSKQIVENILGVSKNGEIINYTDYCAVPNKSWISFKNNLFMNDTIIVSFEFSNESDLIVSNWEQDNGNYIFYYQDSTNTKTVELANQRLFSVFPNPASDQLNIEFTKSISKSVKIEIFTTEGVLVKSLIRNSGNQIKISINEFKRGIYIVKISTKNLVEINKIIIE